MIKPSVAKSMTKCHIERDSLKALSVRSNAKGLFYFTLHLSILAILGSLFVWLSNGPLMLLCIPVLLFYGMVFTFLGYAGLGHELNHGTVFKSATLNRILFFAVSFLTWNNPIYFRASHMQHHKYTLEQGVDYESNPHPYPLIESWWRYAFFDAQAFFRALDIFKDNAFNRVLGSFGERHFAPETPARKRLVRTARCFALGHCVLMSIFLGTGFWQGFFLFTLAPFICTWPNRALAKLQHVGMKPDSNDYRENSRTILIHPFWSFLYWNMNYHLEHHMYPAVPFCNLPKLRMHLQDELPQEPYGLINQLHHLRMPKA